MGHCGIKSTVQRIPVNNAISDELLRLKSTFKDCFPKIGIFIITYNDLLLLTQTIDRIPKELFNLISEIFIFEDCSTNDTYKIITEYYARSFWKDKLKIFKNPTKLGYGDKQKVGYRYAINIKLDYVILLHGDGQHDPELIPELILPIIRNNEQVVFGASRVDMRSVIHEIMPLYKRIVNQMLTRFGNMVLNLNLSEFHTRYRIFSTEILSRIPFEENTDDFHFDTQIIIQLRALDISICEVPIHTHYGENKWHGSDLKYAVNSCKSVIEYRLHQLHLIRTTKYLIKKDSKYTFKKSKYSSHGRILSIIKNPGLALDLGSNQGLLTDKLLEKGVRSVGIDKEIPSNEKTTFKSFFVADLDEPSTLNFNREFDYIILADILEHLKNPEKILLHVQRFLKPSGEIIISVPNIANWYCRLSLMFGRFHYGDKGILDYSHLRFFTYNTTLQLVRKSGYSISEVQVSSLPFEVVFESIGRSKILKFIDFVYYRLALFWPNMFAYQFIVRGKIQKLSAEEKEGIVIE